MRSPSLLVQQIAVMNVKQQDASTILAPLPPLFELVQISDGELELCPGVRLASAARNPGGIVLPPGVAYCYVSPIAPMTKGIRRMPFHLAESFPPLKGCELLFLPAVLQLTEGVKLVQGAALPPFTKLPANVLIVQRDAVAAAAKILPPGMRSVQLSTLLQAPPEFKLPSLVKRLTLKATDDKQSTSAGGDGSSLILVQMHTSVRLPGGVEVAPGCEIAENADEESLPHGVQLVRCHDDCEQFPPFMTPLKVLSVNDRLVRHKVGMHQSSS